MKRVRLILYMLSAIILSGCSSISTSESDWSCAVQPEFPMAEDGITSWTELLQLYFHNASIAQLNVSRHSVNEVEKALRSNAALDLEDAFYDSMFDEISRICDASGSVDASFDAVAYIERQGAALAYAAGLREMRDAEILRLLPSSQRNLTVKMNLAILGASCSRAMHPRVAAVLASRGLGCGS